MGSGRSAKTDLAALDKASPQVRTAAEATSKTRPANWGGVSRMRWYQGVLPVMYLQSPIKSTFMSDGSRKSPVANDCEAICETARTI
jgi:hypothetical protein